MVLAVRVKPQAAQHPRTGPDTVSLGIEESDGAFAALAELDGRYLSTEVAGGFTGRVIGMYAATGTVRFDWFDDEDSLSTAGYTTDAAKASDAGT